MAGQTHHTISAKAFLVRSINYGESDKIVHLLTREQGKVAVLAKAARKSKKRFGAALSPYTLIEVRFRHRSSGGLGRLSEATVLEPFPKVATSLPRMALAGYFTELCRETVPEGKPEPEIFDLLHSAFRLLEQRRPNRAMVRAFEMNFLHRLGLSPRLHVCSAPGCGTPIDVAACDLDAPSPPQQSASDNADEWRSDKTIYGFSPALGGILCPKCAGRYPCIPLEAASLSTMIRLSQMGLGEAVMLPKDIAEDENDHIKAALAPVILDLVGHPLKSVAFINQLQQAHRPPKEEHHEAPSR